MPVVGLPTAAEISLQALLNTAAVSSFKIVGDGRNLTFVLRLQTCDSENNTCAATDNYRPTATPIHQAFRKKPPSQVRRDKQRAQKRRDTLAQASDEQSVEILPSTELCHVFNATSTKSDKDHVLKPVENAPCELSGASVTSDPGQLNAKAAAYIPLGHVTSAPGKVQARNAECLVPPSGAAMAVYSKRLSKNKTLQSRLKDKKRNKFFSRLVRKVSLHGIHYFLVETEDLVLVFYPDEPESRGRGAVKYWFVKQDEKFMESEELLYMKLLSNGPFESAYKHLKPPQQETLHETIQALLSDIRDGLG